MKLPISCSEPFQDQCASVKGHQRSLSVLLIITIHPSSDLALSYSGKPPEWEDSLRTADLIVSSWCLSKALNRSVDYGMEKSKPCEVYTLFLHLSSL